MSDDLRVDAKVQYIAAGQTLERTPARNPMPNPTPPASPNSPTAAVAVIELNSPPVNALSHAVRKHLVDELTAAEANPAIKAVVLIGTDEFFSGGADVKEFNTPKAAAEPSLDTLIRRFE